MRQMRAPQQHTWWARTPLRRVRTPGTEDPRPAAPDGTLRGRRPLNLIPRRLRVRCIERGAFRFGPMELRLSDPYGLLTREQRVENTAMLLVYPLIAPIQRFGLPAHSPFGESKSPLRLLEDPLRVAGTRPYMPGDEPRRIHWKATARAGALYSKIYEPATRQTVVVFVDVRTYQRSLFGYDPSLAELAISAAASIASCALH